MLKLLPCVLRNDVVDWYKCFERARLEEFYRTGMLKRYMPRKSLSSLQATGLRMHHKCTFSAITLNCIHCHRPPSTGHASCLLVNFLRR